MTGPESQIRREIGEQGSISFARFMELALYHPQGGYYSRPGQGPGKQGDYVTASDSGRAFGRCVARQLEQIDRLVGPFDPFTVLEFGAGRGLLARDVRQVVDEDHPELAGRLRYLAVDRSDSMRLETTRQAPDAEALSPDAPVSGRHGCLLAVELFDALPVDRLRRRDGKLVEVRVSLDAEGALVEAEGEPSAAQISFAERYGAARTEGSEAEVCPGLAEQFDRMNRTLERGIWIVVDYGDRSGALYGEDRRRGTLLAYHRHGTNEEYLARVGEQDLTSHVNFTALQDLARERGLEVLGYTTQDRFLIGNGILEAFTDQQADHLQDPRRVRSRLQAMQLIHPQGMGRAFKVLVLAKNCRPRADLSGLHDPFARDA